MADYRRLGMVESGEQRSRGSAEGKSESNEGTNNNSGNHRNIDTMFYKDRTFRMGGPDDGPMPSMSGMGHAPYAQHPMHLSNVNTRMPPPNITYQRQALQGREVRPNNSSEDMNSQNYSFGRTNQIPHPPQPPPFMQAPSNFNVKVEALRQQNEPNTTTNNVYQNISNPPPQQSVEFHSQLHMMQSVRQPQPQSINQHSFTHQAQSSTNQTPRIEMQHFPRHFPPPLHVPVQQHQHQQAGTATFNLRGPYDEQIRALPPPPSGPPPFPNAAVEPIRFNAPPSTIPVNMEQNLQVGRPNAVPGYLPKQSLQAPPPQQQTVTPQQLYQPEKRQQKKQNEMDQDWIYEWLFSKNVLDREKEVEVKPKLTIGEFKQLLKDAIVLNDQLAEQRDNLVKYIEKDESSWQFEYRKANKIKEKLVKVQAQLHDAEQLSLIKQKITKVQRKRESSRRRKARRRSEKEEAAKRREELHRKIDEKFTEEENKKLEKKRELELQKEVDKIFFEVRQKKAEANKALNLLKLLRKLRHLRKESAEKKGAHTSVSSTQAFESTIERLEKLMKRQRDIYMDEEKTMQVMMEVEQEENKEKEKEIQRRHLRDRAKRVVKEQLKCLFGHEEAATPEDPIYPFRQYYLQAENNPQALLEIRHQWDSFLVTEGTPGSSSIPVDWIIPDTPNDETWASCLDSA